MSLLTHIHFRVPSLIFGPLVAKYLAENGVSGTLKKNYWLNSFHTWHLYPYGVNLLTPIHFRVPSLIFGPLVAKYLAENGVSRTFWKTFWLNSVFSWGIPTCAAHKCKIEIFIGYFWMRWVVIRLGLYCPRLWAQLVDNLRHNCTMVELIKRTKMILPNFITLHVHTWYAHIYGNVFSH